MSIIDQARIELKAINFGDEDSKVMMEILEKFFGQWDSGGAVWAVAPVLQKLIAGKPLSPLTGEDDEFVEVDEVNHIFQNKRCSTVFKDPRYHGGKLAYDIDNPDGSRVAIAFPYTPCHAEVGAPIMDIDTGDED